MDQDKEEAFNVFEKLKRAAENIRESLEQILELAPSKTVYNTLVAVENTPFIKTVINTPDAIKLSDTEIKFAVYVKDLYESGKLDVVKHLVNNDFDYFNREICSNRENLKTATTATLLPSPSPSPSASTPSVCFPATQRETSASSCSSIGEAIDASNDIIYVETDIFHDTKDGGDPGINEAFEKRDRKDDDVSELFISSSLNIYDCKLDESDECIHRRSRKFDVLKEDNPPALPIISDARLLSKIFTHQSVLNYLNIPEESKINLHNERLEFLGDAYLQFLSSIIIYEKFPNFNEGQLSMLRSEIVSNNRLLKLSRIYGFDKQLKKNFNDSSILTGNNKLYADVFEAYLGGVVEQYMIETLDGETNTTDFIRGWFEAKHWIEELCEDQLRSFDPSIVFKMHYSKSSKQDLRLLLGQINVPEYIRCRISNRKMISCVKIANKIYGYGIGTSNKEADSRAAVDAMSNPGIQKICPEDLWHKFEESMGLDHDGGLKFEQYCSKVGLEELAVLKKEIAIKYKNGDIKLLVSKNNPCSLLIDDQEREKVSREQEEKHSIGNTTGELSHALCEAEDSCEKRNGVRRAGETRRLEKREGDRRYSADKYYPKEYTMGRGGIFGEESARVLKGRCRHKGGIFRNQVFEVMDTGDNGNSSRYATRKMLCHEVYVKSDHLEMNSKNHMNAIFSRRGNIPNYIMYRTNNDEYLCELWFGNRQIVGYGLDRNKKMASQKAAMLAWKREEYYGYDHQESDGSEESEYGTSQESGSQDGDPEDCGR